MTNPPRTQRPSMEGYGVADDQGAMLEITPRMAFGLIERAEEFASAATRWVSD